jgi:7-cyano-7-deazaguanine synthase
VIPVKAVVLLSGGLDSYTAAAIAREAGYDLYALTVSYGQRHARELDAAHVIARALAVKAHRVLAVDLAAIGGSALLGEGDVPKSGSPDPSIIPPTYVAWAEVLGAFDIYIGVNAVDYSGYPDCRPEYIDAFERLAALATKAGVEGARIRIRTPLIALSKAEIVRKGLSLGLDYALTHSCYDPLPDGRPCGRCDSCVLRSRGFADAGVPDPLGSVSLSRRGNVHE